MVHADVLISSAGVQELEPSMLWSAAVVGGMGAVEDPKQLHHDMHTYLASTPPHASTCVHACTCCCIHKQHHNSVCAAALLQLVTCRAQGRPNFELKRIQYQ